MIWIPAKLKTGDLSSPCWSSSSPVSTYPSIYLRLVPIRSPRIYIVPLSINSCPDIIVLFPFHIPFYVPRVLSNGFLDALSALRIISPRQKFSRDGASSIQQGKFIRLEFPMNFATAPLIADLFLLAILAIGRQEVHDGIVGANNIVPYDIMIFFITLAYIAISIDASGLIRYLAFKVLQKGGKVGHRLFLYLYLFFFVVGSFIGNDPIILSGTAFLAYMTRVSSNIVHPRAWIYSQFAVANIASAILVSSNPTNLVLAGAFKIKFIDYTANMIVPVLITAIVLFPFLLYIVFADESLIPISIKMHELSEEAKAKKPVNPNIPNARGTAEEMEDELPNGERGQLLSLEEIMNPFLDKSGASFGGIVMAGTLIAVLAINASNQNSHPHPVFWVTLPAAVVMLCWDIAFGWFNRRSTREIARQGRDEVERARAERAVMNQNETAEQEDRDAILLSPKKESLEGGPSTTTTNTPNEKQELERAEIDESKISHEVLSHQDRGRTTLASFISKKYRWLQETFPTVTAVLAHLPLPLIPFAFCMFILVQALVTKGWVPVFAHGWDHWVNKTGTVGAVGGMAFLSVILCNVSRFDTKNPSSLT